MSSRREIDALVRRAWTFVDAGQVAPATEQFDRAIALAPDDAALHLEKGVAMFKLGRHEAALAAFDGALAQAPDDVTATANRAKVLRLLGRDAESLAGYDRALELAPGSVKAMYGRVDTLSALGRLDEALVAAEAALEADPKSPDGHYWLGHVLLAVGRLEDAKRELDEAVGGRPGFFDALQERARLHQKESRQESALNDFVAAQRVKPDDVGVALAITEVLIHMGRSNEALGTAQRAMSLDQNNPLAWRYKGRAHMMQKNPAHGHLCLGMALFLEGEHEAALKDLDQALEHEPRLGQAWSNKAVIYDKLGRREEALAAYDKALDIDPRQVAIWNNKGTLLYFHLARQDEGLRCFKEVVRLDPPRWFKLPEVIRAQIAAPA